MALSVSSPALKDGGRIPARYTCQGQDISPPLSWSDPPAGTQSFAIIVDDPDAPAGTFTHWVIYNIPAGSRSMPEAVPTQPQLADGTRHGRNDSGDTGYYGPCPPPGKPHRYQFTVYALGRMLNLAPGASKKHLLSTMQGHILTQGRLTGIYQR